MATVKRPKNEQTTFLEDEENKSGHQKLVELGAKWLSRDHVIVATEIACVREEPDCLGIKYQNRTTLIECKHSRSDYLSESKKIFRERAEMGMGNYRYYLTPPGLVDPNELRDGWGLLEASKNFKSVRVVRMSSFFSEKNYNAEMAVLVSIIRRIGNKPIDGVSIRAYTLQTKCKATVGIGKEDEEDEISIRSQGHDGRPASPQGDKDPSLTDFTGGS